MWRTLSHTANLAGQCRKATTVRAILTKAIDSGPSHPPLIEVPIPEHFASIVERHRNRIAVISKHQKQRLSYNELDRESNALAYGLTKLGVSKGDRIAVSMGNNIEYAILTYALFQLGAILVPLNPAFTETQVISALNHLTASHLIIGAETNLSRKPPRSNLPLLQSLLNPLLGNKPVPSLSEVVVTENSSGRVSLSSLPSIPLFSSVRSAGKGQTAPTPSLLADEVVNIQFTSGTTSTPKAACLTHRSILNNGNSIGDRMLLTEKDVVCCPPPLFHCFGCILGYMATATHGSAIVFPTEAFDALASLQAVQEEGCTALYGVPTMFLAELELVASGAVENKGFDKLRTGIAAGSSVPAELMRRLHKVLNLTELTICYGMTETSPVSAMTTTDDPVEKRIDSVGRLLPHVSAKVVDPADHSRVLGIGEKGELAVSGYLVMKGYWGDEKKTQEVLRADEEGKVWMHTGDQAEMDENGYVKITGRIKDLIIRGGENISPLEIENVILAHPRVLDASVVGVKDQKYGEVVCAFVIPHSEQMIEVEEVRSWVRDRLSSFMVPKYVFFVGSYPKTASGKIQKFSLRAQAEEQVKAGKGAK